MSEQRTCVRRTRRRGRAELGGADEGGGKSPIAQQVGANVRLGIPEYGPFGVEPQSIVLGAIVPDGRKKISRGMGNGELAEVANQPGGVRGLGLDAAIAFGEHLGGKRRAEGV